jgi:hypothetical protein
MSNNPSGLPEYTDNYVHRKSEVKPTPKSTMHAVILGQDDGFGDGESIEHKKWIQAGRPRGKEPAPKQRRQWTGKEKVLLAICSLRTVRDHQMNMFLEINKVREKYKDDEQLLKVIDEINLAVVGRMTAGDIDGISIDALKVVAPEMYDDHVPMGEIFKKLEAMFK